MTNKELLEKKIDESGFKRNFLAEKMGITPVSLAKKINNETEFKASEIRLLCDFLKIASWKEMEQIFFAN